MDGLRYSPDDPYYRLGPVYKCLYVRVRETGDWDLFPDRLRPVYTCLFVRVRETGDWDLFPGPPEQAETGGADRGVIAKGIPRGCKGE